MRWEPGEIVGKVSETIYQVSANGRIKNVHVDFIRARIEKEEPEEPEKQQPTSRYDNRSEENESDEYRYDGNGSGEISDHDYGSNEGVQPKKQISIPLNSGYGAEVNNKSPMKSIVPIVQSGSIPISKRSPIQTQSQHTGTTTPYIQSNVMATPVATRVFTQQNVQSPQASTMTPVRRSSRVKIAPVRLNL